MPKYQPNDRVLHTYLGEAEVIEDTGTHVEIKLQSDGRIVKVSHIKVSDYPTEQTIQERAAKMREGWALNYDDGGLICGEDGA